MMVTKSIDESLMRFLKQMNQADNSYILTSFHVTKSGKVIYYEPPDMMQ